MPDSNPKLTASLHSTRDILLRERKDIVSQMRELQSRLDRNSTEIEATDTLMLRFNPEHISFDVSTDLEAAPMLEVKRPPQLASSTSAEALLATQQPEQPSEQQQAKTTHPKKAAKPAKGKAKSKAGSKAKSKAAASETAETSSEQRPEASPSAEQKDPADKSAQRSPARQAMAEYFHKSRRNDTILKILEAKDEPVNAATVASDYRALYPLPGDSAEMRALHNSRIASALHYLKDRGQAIRIADERGEGKPGENVRWELSKTYRSELRKSRRTAKSESHPTHLAAPAVEAAQVSATTH